MLNLLSEEPLFVDAANGTMLLGTNTFSEEGVGSCCGLLNPYAASVCQVGSMCAWWFHICVNTDCFTVSPIKHNLADTVFDEQHSQSLSHLVMCVCRRLRLKRKGNITEQKKTPSIWNSTPWLTNSYGRQNKKENVDTRSSDGV